MTNILKGAVRKTAQVFKVGLVALVGFETVTIYQAGDITGPGPVSAVVRATNALQLGVLEQIDEINWTVRETLNQIEYACSHGIV